MNKFDHISRTANNRKRTHTLIGKLHWGQPVRGNVPLGLILRPPNYTRFHWMWLNVKWERIGSVDTNSEIDRSLFQATEIFTWTSIGNTRQTSSHLAQELHPETRSWSRDRKINVMGRRGIRRKQLPTDLRETREYWQLKEEAPDRTLWRTGFGEGYGPVVMK